MRICFATVLLFIVELLSAQCPYYLYEMDEEPAWFCPNYGSNQLGPYEGAQPGWTYSWSPSAGLDYSNVCNPMVTVTSGSDRTYVLTVTAPGCGSFVAGSIRVRGVVTPSISPIGPITFYYQYEGIEYIVLTSSEPNNNWYKNGSESQHIVKSWSESGNTLSIALTGLGTGTDYYKTDNGIWCTDFSNVVAITHVGCNDETDYPVTNTWDVCASQYPRTLYQPNLGTGTVYTWSSYDPTCYPLSNMSSSSNTCTVDINCTWPNYSGVSIYTRALKPDGTETRMDFGIFANPACRRSVHNPPKNVSIAVGPKEVVTQRQPPLITKAFLSPNPANDQVTIRAVHGIKRIEVISSTGVLVRNIQWSGSMSTTINTGSIPAGIYTCRVFTNEGTDVLRLVIAR